MRDLLGERPRPTRNDVKPAMIAKLARSLVEWRGKGTLPADIERDLDRAIYCLMDGYEIACRLDDNGWCPDAELVELLDCAMDLWREAEQQAERDWVAATGLQLVHKVGDQVSTARGLGIIARRDEDTGCYVVATDPDQLAHTAEGTPHGWLLKAEDVSAPAQEPADA